MYIYPVTHRRSVEGMAVAASVAQRKRKCGVGALAVAGEQKAKVF